MGKEVNIILDDKEITKIRRQRIEKNTANTMLAKRDLTDFASAKSTHKVYHREATEGWICGATNLTETEWTALATIRSSPRVEYWDGTNWLEVYPDDGSDNLINDKPAGEIEITFTFPERQMNY